MARMKKYKFILLPLILLIGITLRFYKLGSHDLWYDEILSVEYSNHLDRLASDQNPPLYYIIIRLWNKFFKGNEFLLRFPSFIFGILSIIFIYKLGKFLLGFWCGIFSSFIFSISPIHIWYSQEARGYALSIFLIIMMFYLFLMSLEKDKNYLWAGFTVLATLGIYTSYFVLLFLLTGTLIMFFKEHRRFIRKWLISSFFIVILFSPQVLSFLRDIMVVKNNFWLPKPFLGSFLITLENFTLGYNAASMDYSISILLYLFLFFLGVLYAERRRITILLSFLFLPVVVTFVISHWIPIYIDRQLILFSPFYYIIVAAGLNSIKRTALKIMFLISIMLLSSFSLYNYYLDYIPAPYIHHIGVCIKKPVRPAVRYIRDNLKKGDIIAYSNSIVASPFINYLDDDSVEQYYFISSQIYNPYWGRTIREWMSRRKKPYMIDLTRSKDLTFKRIWLVTSLYRVDEKKIDYDTIAVINWLEEHYTRIRFKNLDGISVLLYEKR